VAAARRPARRLTEQKGEREKYAPVSSAYFCVFPERERRSFFGGVSQNGGKGRGRPGEAGEQPGEAGKRAVIYIWGLDTFPSSTSGRKATPSFAAADQKLRLWPWQPRLSSPPRWLGRRRRRVRPRTFSPPSRWPAEPPPIPSRPFSSLLANFCPPLLLLPSLLSPSAWMESLAEVEMKAAEAPEEKAKVRAIILERERPHLFHFLVQFWRRLKSSPSFPEMTKWKESSAER